MSNKKQLGQYFTVENPFKLKPFKDWFFAIEDWENETLLEPFAGANNIVKMIQDITGDIKNKWECYDIEPPTNNVCPEFKVIKQDTLANYPKNFNVAITNPPYLAKNSATRKKLQFVGDPYDDLYKKSLEVMLNNNKYVAAIIPESFITAELFHERLNCVISLVSKMFNDTECPVCLALFGPDNTEDFDIYRNDKFIGKYSKLSKFLYKNIKTSQWKVNDKNGNIGCLCIDNTKSPTIKFVRGETIPSEEIIVSSRTRTRISGLNKEIDIDAFIEECNKELKKYRSKTEDVFMTSFKGLREDGKYRRRLDFKTMKQIMSTVENKLKEVK